MFCLLTRKLEIEKDKTTVLIYKKRLPSSGSLMFVIPKFYGTGVPVGTAVLAVMYFAAA